MQNSLHSHVKTKAQATKQKGHKKPEDLLFVSQPFLWSSCYHNRYQWHYKWVTRVWLGFGDFTMSAATCRSWVWSVHSLFLSGRTAPYRKQWACVPLKIQCVLTVRTAKPSLLLVEDGLKSRFYCITAWWHLKVSCPWCLDVFTPNISLLCLKLIMIICLYQCQNLVSKISIICCIFPKWMCFIKLCTWHREWRYWGLMGDQELILVPGPP